MNLRTEHLGRWLKMSFPVGELDPAALPLQLRSIVANLETGQDDVFEALDRLAAEPRQPEG